MGQKWAQNTCGKDLGPSGPKVDRNGSTEPCGYSLGRNGRHVRNLPKRVIFFLADVYLRGRTKSTEESDLFPRGCICKRAYEIYRRE